MTKNTKPANFLALEEGAALSLTKASRTANVGSHVAYLLDARKQLDAAERALVAELREQHGMTWQEIGNLYGVTRQAAQQRFRE